MSNGVLRVRPSLLECVAGVFGGLVVRRDQVVGARVVADGLAEVRGLRAPGLHIPGVNKYGTWRRRGSKTYVAVRRGRTALVLDLKEHHYDRVVVSAEQASRLAEQLVEQSS
jgi:hypothetical protein